MVTWQKNPTSTPSHFTDTDNERSVVIDSLSGFKHTRFDTEESKAEKLQRKQHYRQQRCYLTSHITKDEKPLEHEKQTPFVNAAVESTEDSAR